MHLRHAPLLVLALVSTTCTTRPREEEFTPDSSVADLTTVIARSLRVLDTMTLRAPYPRSLEAIGVVVDSAISPQLEFLGDQDYRVTAARDGRRCMATGLHPKPRCWRSPPGP